jgi:hypothetical protein
LWAANAIYAAQLRLAIGLWRHFDAQLPTAALTERNLAHNLERELFCQ